MATRQFSFSFSVGITLALLGGFIAGQAPIGFSLLALGAAISTLALLTRGTHGAGKQAVPSTASGQRLQASATDH